MGLTTNSTQIRHTSNVVRITSISSVNGKVRRDQVETLLQEYADVFSGRPNLTDIVTHRIDTADSPPIRCTPYKVPQKLDEDVNKEITKMLEMGIIRPSTEKSAFITSKGLYEFLVLPFGMKTAPATFQRMMSDVVLKGLGFADAYIDDVEVDTPTSFSQHLLELRQVLQRLRECKLHARPS